MTQAEAVAAFLSDFLSKTPGQTLTGTQVAQVLRMAFKDFKPSAYGCVNVRAFVLRYAPNVKEVGSAGADRIFSLNATPDRSLVTPPPDTTVNSKFVSRRTPYMDISLWKTFVSPNTIFKLFANKETAVVRVVKPQEPQPVEPWVRIPTLSSEFHLRLATEFADSLPSLDKREAIKQLLSSPRWWMEIQAVTLRLGVAAEWNSYRRRRILEEYQDLLKAGGIPVIGQIEPMRPRPVLESQLRESHPRLTAAPQQGRSLREVILRAVEKMTPAELRSLAIPLGYVADELDLN